VAGRPPVGATFEVERVGGRRSHASRAAALCVAGVAALIGVGVLGRTLETGPAVADSTPGITDSIADLARTVPAPGDHVLIGGSAAVPPIPGSDPINLRSPAIGPITVTSATLTVLGSVNVRSDHVQVALQTRNERTLGQASVDVSSAWDVFRPDESPTFRVVFDLRAPRRLGTMWIEVTVYDTKGRELAYERRAFIVGPMKGA
jgi:hypothetical protein